MEVDGLAPGKTILLYQQGVVHFHVCCREGSSLKKTATGDFWGPRKVLVGRLLAESEWIDSDYSPCPRLYYYDIHTWLQGAHKRLRSKCVE